MRFIFQQEMHAYPDENEYRLIRPGVVEVHVWKELPRDEQGEEILPSDNEEMDVLGARIALDFLDVDRVLHLGLDLFDVCDEDSNPWAWLHDALFDGKGELLDGALIESRCSELALIYKACFHPGLNDWRDYIISSITDLMPYSTVLATYPDISPTPPLDLERLGFHATKRSELVVREGTLKHPYSHLDEPRNPHDVRLPADATEFVKNLWVGAACQGRGPTHLKLVGLDDD